MSRLLKPVKEKKCMIKPGSNSRLLYDKLFLIPDTKKYPIHNGRVIEELYLSFLYFYYSKDNQNEEILFPSNEELMYSFESAILPDVYYCCSYNRKEGYTMTLREKMLSESDFSRVDYCPSGASVLYTDSAGPEFISFSEAVSILKSNPEAFDNPENKDALDFTFVMVPIN